MVQRVFRALVSLVAPPSCVCCGAAGGDPLCGGCRAELPWLPQGRSCPRCALPLPCGAPCPARRAAFTRAYAPLAHDGPARELVHALKFRGRLALAELMAAQIAANAPRDLLAGTLVAVPTHPSRRRARGFDQAERLAGALARRTGLPVARCLRRRGQASRQLGATRAQRLGARLDLEVRGMAPPVAVLVDDVHTTGRTLDACARALRSAGAAEVVAVTYARTLP